jgi:hypothetical protein
MTHYYNGWHVADDMKCLAIMFALLKQKKGDAPMLVVPQKLQSSAHYSSGRKSQNSCGGSMLINAKPLLNESLVSK